MLLDFYLLKTHSICWVLVNSSETWCGPLLSLLHDNLKVWCMLWKSFLFTMAARSYDRLPVSLVFLRHRINKPFLPQNCHSQSFFSCNMNICLHEDPRKSAISEILKLAHPSPISAPKCKSHVLLHVQGSSMDCSLRLPNVDCLKLAQTLFWSRPKTLWLTRST